MVDERESAREAGGGGEGGRVITPGGPRGIGKEDAGNSEVGGPGGLGGVPAARGPPTTWEIAMATMTQAHATVISRSE